VCNLQNNLCEFSGPILCLETEKFYTDTNVDIEAGILGEKLNFKDGDQVCTNEGPQTVTAVIHPKKATISSYTPGQYYAVTKVTAFDDLDRVWIFEDDRDCTVETGISKMIPAKVPGGAYVALMCDGVTVDLSDELADSGALKINNDGFVEAHVEGVPEGCMVFLGVKYSPGLKGEDAEEVERPFCENWEFVCVSQVGFPTTPNPGDFPEACKSASFRDSAHRVLEVIGLPEPEPTTCEECSVASNDALILCDGELSCIISVQQEFAECTLTCDGDHNGIPEACFNSLSGGFSNCLDFVTNQDQLETCEQEYVEQQIDCAANS